MDLDWLLRLVTPRNFVLLFVAMGLGEAWRYYGNIPRRAYRLWMYPPQSQAPDADIADLLKTREHQHVQAFYQKVCALLEAARADGLQVDGLQAKANAALDLEKAGFKDQAMTTLAEVERDIPRKPVPYIPMDQAAQDQADQFDTPTMLPRTIQSQMADAKQLKKDRRNKKRRKPKPKPQPAETVDQ